MTVRPKDDVLGLHVAVNNPLSVRGRERASDLSSDVDRLLYGQRPTIEARAQCFTLDKFGHDERSALVITDIVDDQDVRVVERRNRPRLSVETAQPLSII